MRLNNEIAIVTGAAQGIGKVFAEALAREGARVVVVDRADPSACVEAIRSDGGEAIGFAADITSRDELDDMVSGVEEAFGNVTILVNNAGIFTALDVKNFWDIDEEEWDRVMRVNVRGVFQTVKACLPSMRRAGRAKIVNMASGSVFFGPPGFLHYVASKAAVMGMTRSLARELGDEGITVNAIAPGLTESEGVQTNAALQTTRQRNIEGRSLKRDMFPADLVGTLLYLVSPDSDFLTGQTINVDGGRIMR